MNEDVHRHQRKLSAECTLYVAEPSVRSRAGLRAVGGRRQRRSEQATTFAASLVLPYLTVNTLELVSSPRPGMATVPRSTTVASDGCHRRIRGDRLPPSTSGGERDVTPTRQHAQVGTATGSNPSSTARFW